MKSALVFLSLVAVSFCEPSRLDVDCTAEDFNEKDFEEYYGLPPEEDPVKFKKKDATLKKNRRKIKKLNAAYDRGEVTWFEDINEYSNLEDDEMDTGLNTEEEERMFAEGRVDDLSEQYFDQFRNDPWPIPDHYSSKELGYVTIAKGQRSCGSCVVFATMGAVETCFARLTNRTGDYSEQQLMDCGDTRGCSGTGIRSYGMWMRDAQPLLAHESDYPYRAEWQGCRADVPGYNQGARVTGFYFTNLGDEELMKQMVYVHGAVLTGIKTGFRSYAGGIYGGCVPGEGGPHAVVVVGYGTENGVDYWLVKNSWGPGWAENGFIRLQRGVGMCNIGKFVGVVECSHEPGPIDPPRPPYCEDWHTRDCTKPGFCKQKNARRFCRKTCDLC